MRNLILFIWRQHFTLLFIALQLISFFLLIQNNSFQRANFLGFTNELSGGAFETVSNIKDYLNLKEVNEQLAEEVAVLKSNQIKASYNLTPWYKIIVDSLYFVQYQYTKARVLNNTVGKRNNYLTLSQGSLVGIEPKMGVVSNDGVVGIVKNVSEHYSSIISLMHSKTQISAKLKKTEYFGVMSWNGNKVGVLQLEDIPSHVSISVGDSIFTRGSSGIFPPNILLGTIQNFEPIEGTDFYKIDVKLSVDYRKIAYVFVISNSLLLEQKKLESTQKESSDN